jgi:hypothetical protein
MGMRGQTYPGNSSIKDQYSLWQRFVGVGAVNGALPFSTLFNRGRGLTAARTGVGTYVFTVQGGGANSVLPGANNYTPQFVNQVECNMYTPGATKWAWTLTQLGITNGVLTFTIQTYIANTGTVTDIPTTDELWIEVDCSANTVA